MPELFTGTKSQIQEVHDWAGEVYKTLLQFSFLPLEERPNGIQCFKVSGAIIEKARKRGYDANPRNFGTYHGFIDLGNGWGADAEWKQFLPPSKRAVTPDVVVAPLICIPLILSGLGASNIRYWVHAITLRKT